MKVIAFLSFGMLLSQATGYAVEPPARAPLDCGAVVRTIGASCVRPDPSPDAQAKTDVARDCPDFGNRINAEETKLQNEIRRCSAAATSATRTGESRVGGGQGRINRGQSGLLGGNASQVQTCATNLGVIEASLRAISNQIKPKIKEGPDDCQSKVREFYRNMKQKADSLADQAKTKAQEYLDAGRVLSNQQDRTKDNADKLGGDQSKAGDSKGGSGGGGGAPDPSSLMKAMSDAKAKQDADAAKKAADDKAAAEKEKARLAQEKAMRQQQCRNNEISRSNAIAKCKSDFTVVPGHVVATMQKDQDDCIANVGSTYGSVVSNCSTVP